MNPSGKSGEQLLKVLTLKFQIKTKNVYSYKFKQIFRIHKLTNIMSKKLYICFLLFLPITNQAFSQSITGLQEKIEHIISDKKAIVGVSVLGIESGDTLAINGNRNFPMMSVFKFHIALTVLKKVDDGQLSLNKKIFINRKDLLETWSPIKDKYPDGNVKLTLDEILKYTVSHSDNNGCDILLRLLGGTQAVQEFINSLGIKEFVIKYNEEQMRDGENAKVNTTTPQATIKLLTLFYNNKILSKNNTKYLYKLMEGNSRGTTLIKGQLPDGTKVAHRTGMSGTDENGLQIALNDAGIIALPNGNHFAIAIYLNNITEKKEVSEKIIADIAKVTWDYFTHKQINH